MVEPDVSQLDDVALKTDANAALEQVDMLKDSLNQPVVNHGEVAGAPNDSDKIEELSHKADAVAADNEEVTATLNGCGMRKKTPSQSFPIAMDNAVFTTAVDDCDVAKQLLNQPDALNGAEVVAALGHCDMIKQLSSQSDTLDDCDMTEQPSCQPDAIAVDFTALDDCHMEVTALDECHMFEELSGQTNALPMDNENVAGAETAGVLESHDMVEDAESASSIADDSDKDSTYETGERYMKLKSHLQSNKNNSKVYIK